MNNFIVRRSARAQRLLHKHFNRYYAGQMLAYRNGWLSRAHALAGSDPNGMKALYVKNARDYHHEYLKALRECKVDDDTEQAAWAQQQLEERRLREEFREFLKPKEIDEKIRHYNQQVRDWVVGS